MKKLLLLYLICSWGHIAFSQTGRLAGAVKDAETKSPLELATVSVFGQDSSFITYQLSDKNGLFSFDKLPMKNPLLIQVSYTGYTNFRAPVLLQPGKTDTLKIFLEIASRDSLGVVLTATIPVRMNGDTLEINPAAFKMKNEAVVEELLNQVSGITIWSDGTITMNGKRIQSLLVDGKPFMGSSDARVATQNLPKSAIDKIQLYQEYDRSKIGQETQPEDSLLTMNIKLKENSKRGYFGKAGAGYGTDDRFESDFSLQMFTKTSSAGIGGGYNNINKNIGNLQEMFQRNTYRNFNPNLYNVGRFGATGINRNYSLGAVYSHSFIEGTNSRQNNRLSVNYNKTGTNTYLSDLTLQNRTALANPQFIRDEGEQNSRGSRHDFGLNYVKTNSYSDNLSLNGAVNTSTDKSNSTRRTEVRDADNNLLSTNSVVSAQTRNSDNQSLIMSLAKSNPEEPAKSFNFQLNTRRGSGSSERDMESHFNSFTDPSQNNTIRRHYSSDNDYLTIGGNLDYSGFKRLLLGRFNLFGAGLNFTQSFNYSSQSDNSRVSDYDSVSKQYILNGGLSNRNKREITEYTPAISLNRNFSRYLESHSRSLYMQVRWLNDFKSDKNSSSIAQRNINRNFHFMRVEGSVGYQYQKRNKYRYNSSFNYTKRYDYPSIDELYTLVDSINVYNIRIGNPNLKNTRLHALNFYTNFNTENPKSPYTVTGGLSSGYMLSVDPITDSVINDYSGKRASYAVNAGNSNTLYANYNFSISRKLNKNSIQLMYNGSARTSKNPNFIDGLSNSSKSDNLANQFTLQYSLGTVFIISLGQSFQQNKNTPSVSTLKAFKNSSNTTKLGITLNYPENLSFSTTIDNIDNSNISKPVTLWNSFITYRFLKQQGELKFSAMDLLKQYQNITNTVNSYGTVTRIANGLQQYFLLTFSYYPRKFGKTELKRPSGQRNRRD